MKYYLLSTQQPDGPPPPSVALEQVQERIDALTRELKAAGAWVFNGHLHPAGTATVMRPQGGELLMTDGPYSKGNEHVGGVCIIKAPDPDAALRWGRKLALATTLPIEVRPFQGGAEG
jgi:hypothetical protein